MIVDLYIGSDAIALHSADLAPHHSMTEVDRESGGERCIGILQKLEVPSLRVEEIEVADHEGQLSGIPKKFGHHIRSHVVVRCPERGAGGPAAKLTPKRSHQGGRPAVASTPAVMEALASTEV